MGCHAGAICGELRCRTVTEPHQFFGESPEKRGISQLRWCSLHHRHFFSLAKYIAKTQNVPHSVRVANFAKSKFDLATKGHGIWRCYHQHNKFVKWTKRLLLKSQKALENLFLKEMKFRPGLDVGRERGGILLSHLWTFWTLVTGLLARHQTRITLLYINIELHYRAC